MGRGRQEAGRQRFLPYTLLFYILLSISRTSAQDTNTLTCDTPLTVEGIRYDLQQLDVQHSASYTSDSPPTQEELIITFNACRDIEIPSSVPESDKCPTGTRACFTKVNKKEGENDRVVSVIPIAQSSALEPKYSILNSPEGLSIHLHGPPFLANGKSVSQMLNLTLLCNKDSSNPSFMSYSYEKGIADVEWNTSAGCKAAETNEPDNTSPLDPTPGRGVSWFFILLLLCFFGYFAIGAYYNYNHFGASGWDLIPHRDFWREVPYMLRDFIDHLCTVLRPGYQSSRRGYVAV